jgi:hypothetical protein
MILYDLFWILFLGTACCHPVALLRARCGVGRCEVNTALFNN